MARVHADGIPVAAHALIKVLIRKVLVACQGVRVGERGLQLEGALEGLQGVVMLLQAGWRALVHTPASWETKEEVRALYSWAGVHLAGHMGNTCGVTKGSPGQGTSSGTGQAAPQWLARQGRLLAHRLVQRQQPPGTAAPDLSVDRGPSQALHAKEGASLVCSVFSMGCPRCGALEAAVHVCTAHRVQRAKRPATQPICCPERQSQGVIRGQSWAASWQPDMPCPAPGCPPSARRDSSP